jgi:hypothetical protein
MPGSVTDRQRPLAHTAKAWALCRYGIEAFAVVGDLKRHAAAVVLGERQRDLAGLRVSQRVRQALLRDAVEHDLDIWPVVG